MYLPGDADLIRRDSRLPGLRLLLDPAEVARFVQPRCPSLQIISVDADYVRYKPGTSCLVGYRVHTPDGSCYAYARTHGASWATKSSKTSTRPFVTGPLGFSVILLDVPPVALFSYPNDHELPALRFLNDDAGRQRILRRLLPDHPAWWAGAITGIKYKPERRLVARVDVDEVPRAALKFYTRSEFGIALANADCFRSTDAYRVPKRLGRSHRRNDLALEWVAGRPSIEVLANAGAAATMGEMVGAGMAGLHTSRSRPSRRFEPSLYVMSMFQAAASIQATSPRLGHRAADVARRIAGQLGRHQWTMGPIHGDLSLDQIMLDEAGRLTILDFDRAGVGSPGIDLGGLEADCIRRELNGEWSAEQRGSFLEAVGAAYRLESPRGLGVGAVSLFTAASLLRAAVEPFRHRQPEWPQATEALLEQAASRTGEDRGVDRSACGR